jgi:hypothetical protein
MSPFFLRSKPSLAGAKQIAPLDMLFGNRISGGKCGIIADMCATSILDRFFDPVTRILPPVTAQQILDIRIDPELQSRLDALAEKANQGTLSAEEREQYEEFVEGLDLIAVFKLKARAALGRQAS